MEKHFCSGIGNIGKKLRFDSTLDHLHISVKLHTDKNVSLCNSLLDLFLKFDTDLILLFIFSIRPAIKRFSVNSIYPYNILTIPYIFCILYQNVKLRALK